MTTEPKLMTAEELLKMSYDDVNANSSEECWSKKCRQETNTERW